MPAGSGERNAAINKSLIRVGSMFNDSANPPQTPAILFSVLLKYTRFILYSFVKGNGMDGTRTRNHRSDSAVR